MSPRRSGGRLTAALFLALSGAAALGASVLVYTVIRDLEWEANQTRGPETVSVTVARHDIVPGRVISATDLALVDVPYEFVPDSVMRGPEQAVGRVSRERILQHEYIREERLAAPEAGSGMEAIIPRGMRALSIDIGDGSAVSGFVEPGNYVDVVVTLPGEGSRPAETVTLLQAVTVLAVDARLGPGVEAAAEGPHRPSVTLALTPDLVERLTHASAQGEVRLTLRSDIDVMRLETNGAFTEDLIGAPATRIPVKEWVEQRAVGDGLLIIRGPEVLLQ